MRKIDKQINIIKSNLLCEQRYLTNKGVINESDEEQIQELSPNLRFKASEKARIEARKSDNDLTTDKRHNQGMTISQQINQSIIRELEGIATQVLSTVEVGKQTWAKTPSVGISFISNENEENSRDKRYTLSITKDKVSVLYDQGIRFPDNLLRRLERITIKIQNDEIPDNETKYKVNDVITWVGDDQFDRNGDVRAKAGDVGRILRVSNDELTVEFNKRGFEIRPQEAIIYIAKK